MTPSTGLECNILWHAITSHTVCTANGEQSDGKGKGERDHTHTVVRCLCRDKTLLALCRLMAFGIAMNSSHALPHCHNAMPHGTTKRAQTGLDTACHSYSLTLLTFPIPYCHPLATCRPKAVKTVATKGLKSTHKKTISNGSSWENSTVKDPVLISYKLIQSSSSSSFELMPYNSVLKI